MSEKEPGFDAPLDEVLDFFGVGDRTIEAVLYALWHRPPLTTAAETLCKRICIHDLSFEDLLQNKEDAQLCADALQSAHFKDPEIYAKALQAQDDICTTLSKPIVRPSYRPFWEVDDKAAAPIAC